MSDLQNLAEKIGLKPTDKENKKWLLPTVIAVIFILLLLIIGNSLVLFEFSYMDKFYPGSSIGQIKLAGLNRDQAFKVVEEAAAKIDQQAVQIEYYDGTKQQILLLDQALNPDSATDFLDFDIYKSVYDNYNSGHNGNWGRRLLDQWRLWAGYGKQKAVFKLNQEYLKKMIVGQLQSLEIKVVNAAPQITCQNNNCQVEISGEKSGKSFNYDEALSRWSDGLSRLEYKPIKLTQTAANPLITKSEVIGLTGKLQEFFSSSSTPEYYYQDKKWIINKAELAKIIDFEQGKDIVYISINQDNFNKWFSNNIGSELDMPAQNASIQIIDGKVVSLSSHKNGQTADKEKAYLDLKGKIINQDFNNLRFELKVVNTAPDVVTENINDLGIKEIIGIGESNFAGSPTNRRKNISNGAKRLNGLLIKPDEDFSLIKTLLPVDASTGYFTELVIKGNKTVPEYGGGLCQIGTTVFRAALSTGLPILERANHSYSVTYYLEKGLPGVDATIYDPKPDLRFKNDTGNYILIQTRIAGDKLYFEFWGTKDGRTAVRTTPKTWGVKSPPPTKTVETTDLAPGVKKCTESSHKGISASFNYIVNYADGRNATTTFTSIYKPWQAVCLVGVAAIGVSSSTGNLIVSNP
ncbi:MAG: VanW family protein [Candidatus Buchananbacteria bacterium]|jgi:vancomycin resistance protein YoaR